MKRLALTLLFITLSATATAQQKATADPVLDLYVPKCTSSTLKVEPFEGKLPGGMTAESLSIESTDPTCHFDAIRVKTGDGRSWVGNPWPLSNMQGTPANRIKEIAWSALQLVVVVEPGASEGGLQKVRVNHVTEPGRIPVDGLVDNVGIMFFPGEFSKNAAEMKAKIDARLAPIIAKAPVRGPEGAPVTVIEFSDFQCPSCKRGSDAFEPFYEANAGKIRYIRIDMPIISAHPWAFPAAVIGRAIWKQSPEVFWQYKKAIYENQSNLNAFEIAQFGRNFVEDHELDVKRFDADVSSDAVSKEILESLGTTFTLGIAATPTYIVNGVTVATGPESSFLKSYIEKLLAGK